MALHVGGAGFGSPPFLLSRGSRPTSLFRLSRRRLAAGVRKTMCSEIAGLAVLGGLRPRSTLLPEHWRGVIPGGVPSPPRDAPSDRAGTAKPALSLHARRRNRAFAAKKAAGRRLQVTVLARWEPEGGARRCVSSLLCPRLRHVEAILSGASSARSAAFQLSGGMDVKCRIIDRLYPRGSMFRLSIYDVRGERRAIQGERAGGTATKGGHR